MPAQEHGKTTSPRSEGLPRPRQHTNRTGLSLRAVMKRCIDIGGAAFLLLLLSPVFAILAVLILAEDGKPVLHRRRVVGPHGEFDAFKFRTMVRNADGILAANPQLRAEYERNFKLQSDPRVTRIGRVLRRVSLDELPQLFNVLRGEMSLVGPRMITAPELQKYGPYSNLLLTVKPGLTGHWQVNGRQNVSYDERVSMDVYYIQNWSLILDLKILFATPFKILLREGAY